MTFTMFVGWVIAAQRMFRPEETARFGVAISGVK